MHKSRRFLPAGETPLNSADHHINFDPIERLHHCRQSHPTTLFGGDAFVLEDVMLENNDVIFLRLLLAGTNLVSNALLEFGGKSSIDASATLSACLNASPGAITREKSGLVRWPGFLPVLSRFVLSATALLCS